MADPREVTLDDVLGRIAARLERQGVSREMIHLVVQAFDQAGFEMRDKGGRQPVPVAEGVEIVRRQIGETADWLLEVDLGERGSLACVETVVAGKATRSAWAHIPYAAR